MSMAAATPPLQSVVIALEKIRPGFRWHQIRELLTVGDSLEGSSVLKFTLSETADGVRSEIHVLGLETGKDIQERVRVLGICEVVEIVDAPELVCNFWCPICEITVNGPGPLEQLRSTHMRGSRHLRCARLGAPSVRGARPRGPELVKCLQEGTVAAASAFEASAAFPDELVLEGAEDDQTRAVQTLRSMSTGRRWPSHGWKNAVLHVLRARGICRFEYFEGTCRSSTCDLRHIHSERREAEQYCPPANGVAHAVVVAGGDEVTPAAPVVQVLAAAVQPTVATPIAQHQPVMTMPNVPFMQPGMSPFVVGGVQPMQQNFNPWGPQVVVYGMGSAAPRVM